jgi:prepilin-type N-terminal cleavage/methylation domain-containing protein
MHEMNRNAGFSLVELIVAIAIMAIIGGSIVGFLSTSSASYKIVSEEADLQEEAQLAMNQLETLLINAECGVAYDLAADTLYIYNSENRYLITWDKDAATLNYSSEKRSKDAASGKYLNTFETSGGTALMAEYLDGFSVSVDSSSGIVADVSMHFVKSEKTYQVSQKVALRNTSLVVSSDPELVYAGEADGGEVTTLYYGMTVQLGTKKFAVGSTNSYDVTLGGSEDVTIPLSVAIKGSYYPSQSYSAKLIGSSLTDSDAKSRVSGDGSSVIIASGETSTSLTLTVISTAAPSLQCTVTIYVNR